jgi:hypothetical protein
VEIGMDDLHIFVTQAQARCRIEAQLRGTRANLFT